MLNDTEFSKLIPSSKKESFKVSKVKIVKESKTNKIVKESKTNKSKVLNEASSDQYRKAFVRGMINAPEYLLQMITPVLQDIDSYINTRDDILPETIQAIEAVKSAMDVAAVAVEAETKERRRTIDYDDQMMSV